ncbi:unnamed protein product, partial [Sphacelaria rigidula]
ELGYEVSASNAAYIMDRQKIALRDPSSQGPRSDESRAGGDRSSEWMQAMSVRWHIMAADKGYSPSFLHIGDAFFYGRGGLPRDTSAACWWYSRASASGSARGSYNLGYMHEHGLGVSRNYELAWTYYDRARESGHADRSDVNQGLDGMPIELLVLLAKTRLFLNRASGGGLGKLWGHGGNENHGHHAEKAWLLPRALVEGLGSSHSVLDRSSNTVEFEDPRHDALWRRTMLSLSLAAG